MPWKERFVHELQSRSLTASEHDLPDDPQTIRDEMAQIANWWSRLDTQARQVIKWSGTDVANALYYARFASRWPGYINLLSQNPAGQVLPATFNEIGRAWAALGQTDDVDAEALRDLVVDDLQDV